MYYEPHAPRNNLVVLTSAHVTKISLSKFAGEEVTAKSLRFLYDGIEYRAFVKNEVIVSAGYSGHLPRGMGKALTRLWEFQSNHVPSCNHVVPVLVNAPHKRRF